MGIHVAIEHRTVYKFDRTTTIHPHIFRLRPAPHSRTPILSYSLKVSPKDHFLNWQQDPFGNYLARLVFNEPSDHLDITVDLVADMTAINPFDFFVEESAEKYPFVYDPQTARDLDAYLRPAHHAGPLMKKWLDGIDRSKRIRIQDFLVGLNQRLYEDIAYSVRMEPGVQTPEQTFERGIGSCRDTGWLLVEALRHLGLAARFVSGYLVQLTSDQPALDGPGGPDADFTDLHAWAEVYVPGAGWIGMDPTSGLFVGEGHIPLACTPHPISAAPITGATSKTEVEFEFANVVRRVREDPRVTLPYTAEQWTAIDALGEQVDERLDAGDVRLTMGGEPTFVSIDDMDGDEWNISADSPAKRALAHDLTERLRDRFAVGGVVQYGQGKWYPGEPLPRWQIGIVWRRDGEPLWNDPTLLADPSSPGTSTNADAEAVMAGIARRFGLGEADVLSAFEDPIDQVWNEARLPAGEPPEVDVTDDEADAIAEPDARRELLERLSGPVAEPAGYVLPMHPSDDDDGWESTRWTLRRGRLYLTPGDSPIGLRLPIDSLTWVPFPSPFQRSPFETRGALPVPGVTPDPVRSDRRDFTDVSAVDPASPSALAVETRDGHVRVFLPPLEEAERAVELLSVIESVAAELEIPVVIEGYAIPRDPRFDMLMVTPDPGVIEVNVQPTGNWADLRTVVETIYEEARLSRLGTEKFALDGSHTGTGGGNHVTLGGVTPADSPLLRRPDLLRSMVTYWQHHPSLSFLFSGQFIGPTSQAPRVDEGRADTLYELEIAFAELERATGDDGTAPPWIVDRLLRHLLVDLTGNTHRSEFCIDKLFSPDSERGRLGILELRAFEMPPHAQMALVQALLVRSLVARFWEEPYSGPLVRWDTELSDRFMLPHFVRSDIHDVVADLQAHGIDFQASWLEPFLEFRFPLIGEAVIDDVRLEVRRAIEPWHVLGEEASGSGTARYVDSSVERLQVQVDGVNPERHVVTCNGVPLPLRASATAGTSVAGVRFKAWAPWSALHPTIDKTGPLAFDVVDRWTRRSLGGATYHVVHPGGLGYESFPVNATEAETRRGSRFERRGHTPGTVDVSAIDELAVQIPVEHPRTLDLRRFAGFLDG
ncbi:transglutaminase family protein [Ilumatobacter nonamiensis]|uniref:transglutaminase family protein n=1 Tax=Ilumatobacter nonamiensis TaxID=467093 RepID=UPI000346E9C2|nr:transglutaminase family protein [Ilumatobacter nonamiensis]